MQGAVTVPPPRRPIWSGSEEHRLITLLAKANGARMSRTLSLAEVKTTVEQALSSLTGFAWAHGGEVDDARALTTVCLAGVGTDTVTVGVSVVHAKGVIPSWGWPDLTDWERSPETANSALVSAWAARRLVDRVLFRLEPAASPASSREALLAAILEHPEYDEPRLVYADALTELNDPRGEFIAVQCARATLPSGDSDRKRLEHREAELLAAHRAQWLEGVPDGVTCTFERGFVERLDVGPRQELDALEPLVQREPVTRLHVGPGVRPGTSLRWGQGLTSLEFRGPWYDAIRFFQARVFPKLSEVALRSSELNAKAAFALGHLFETGTPKLKRLRLKRSINAQGLEQLAPHRWFNALTSLDLSDNALSRQDLEPLIGTITRWRLESLTLDDNRLGDEGASALARSPRLRHLRALSLARNRIGQRGAEELLTSVHLKNLTALSLDQNPIGTKAKERLAARLAR